MSDAGRIALGVALLVFGVLLLYLLLTLWPAVIAAQKGDPATVTWFWQPLHFTADTTLLMLVILVSALGSYVHVTVSFSDFAGNRQLVTSWVWWYLLRVFVGSSLAVLFYFAIRGGFFASSTDPDQVNVFGMAALAGLVGLFSKQATDKLREIFDTAFRTSSGYGDDARGDSVAHPRPTLKGSKPARIGNGQVDVRLAGTGFIQASTVKVSLLGGEDEPREVTYISDTELAVKLLARDVGEAATLVFCVTNPGPGGGTSDPLRVHVAPANGHRAKPKAKAPTVV